MSYLAASFSGLTLKIGMTLLVLLSIRKGTNFVLVRFRLGGGGGVGDDATLRGELKSRHGFAVNPKATMGRTVSNGCSLRK